MSAQPPEPGQPQAPDRAAIRCPRCSAPIGPDQDWCLECGAPARTRLAPTPNWQLPTVAIGAIVAIAGALLAFAFVRLTNDDGVAPAGTTPSAVVETAPPAATVPPAVTATVPTATTTAPAGPAVPSTVPGQTPSTVPATTATTPRAPTPPAGTATIPRATTPRTTTSSPATTPRVTTATTPSGTVTAPRGR